MSNLNDLVFIDNLPKIDLHGFDTDTARVYINDFIKDNIKIGNRFIGIIHGIGSGILRNTTKEVLRKNKNVIDFKTYYYNSGITIVELFIN